MPTIDEIRATAERDLAVVLADLDGRRRRLLLAAVAQYGSVDDIPDSVWAEIVEDGERRIVVALLAIALAADRWTSDEISRQGVAMDDLPADRLAQYAVAAARQAATYSQQAADAIRAKLQRRAEEIKLDSATGLGEATADELSAAIEDTIDGDNEAAAVTEATVAITTGQRGAADRSPTVVDMVWMTERDSRVYPRSPVCPRCLPLHGQSQDVWAKVFPDGPGYAVHPRCRCWLRPIVAKEVA